MSRLSLARTALFALALAPLSLGAQGTSWAATDAAFGRPGAPQASNVMRYNFPRTDLTVTVEGVTLKPAFALGSWVAFLPIEDNNVIAMGDLVLLDSEVPAVMSALQDAGVEQSALHNHLLNESPHIMYMHVMAHGDPVRIAKAVRGALAKSATPLGTPSPTVPVTVTPPLDTVGIARALHTTGKFNGIVYQVSVPRTETITEIGHAIPPSMGLATSINFQPTGGGKAAITGDLVLRGGEVNSVIRILRKNGITVAALHSHLIDEDPKLYFMHFWANDDAVKLATALHAALDITGSKR